MAAIFNEGEPTITPFFDGGVLHVRVIWLLKKDYFTLFHRPCMRRIICLHARFGVLHVVCTRGNVRTFLCRYRVF